MNFCPAAGKSFCYFLALGLVASLLGCRKSETKPQTSPAAGETQARSPASALPAPAPPPPPPPGAPAAPTSYEAAVTARSIDYLKGTIDRKNWSGAQRALTQVESRHLTPEQRQYVDSLKAQIPPGK